MSSVGQVVGGAAGAVIGFFVGGGPAGAIYGAQIGMTVGGIIDPPDGPQLEGPRLQDKQIIVSTYGNAIPLIYGAENRCSGNVIWSTGLIETAEEEESGGGKGGGGGATTTTYSYRMSFALAMGAGTMVGVKRIWANSKLIYDSTGLTLPAVDPVNGQVVTKAMGAHAVMEEMHFWPGSKVQVPDPWIQSYSASTPAYRNVAYIVFKDMQLADFGNRLPNIEVEIAGSAVTNVAAVVQDIARRVGVDDISVTGLTDELRGLVIARSVQASGALTPLAVAFNFDLAEQAGQVRCVKRGAGMKGVVPVGDMGAVQGADNATEPARFKAVTALEMPKTVSLTHLDPELDYQLNSQRAFKDLGNAANIISVDLPLTLGVDDARRIADRTLWEAWTARRSVSFSLTDKWVRRASGDVLGVLVDGQIIPYKVVRISRGDNGVSTYEAQRDDPEVYTSTALGTDGNLPSNVVKFPGVTRLVLMDMPIVQDGNDDTGFYWVVTGESAGWRGADVRRSIDGGSSYSSMSKVGVRSVIGDVPVALPVGPTDFWDRGNTLTVTLDYAGSTLESVSEDLVIAGYNAAWLGPATGQGGEVIQFATATLVGPGQYTLSNLLRGRLGTEANTTHGTNEVFVLLRTATLGRSEFGPADWYYSRLFKPVSVLTNEVDTAAQAFTNNGVGKMPKSPVHVAGVRDGSNNLALSWVRRSRLQVPGLGLGPVPLGELTEAYSIDIYSGASVVRTITATTPAASYTAAEQTADGLTPGNPVTLRIYQLSDVRGRGFPAVATV
jgi:hypothetical protein